MYTFKWIKIKFKIEISEIKFYLLFFLTPFFIFKGLDQALWLSDFKSQIDSTSLLKKERNQIFKLYENICYYSLQMKDGFHGLRS